MRYFEEKSSVSIENDKCIIDINKIDKNIMDKISKNIIENVKFDNLHSIISEISKNGKNAIYQIAYWPEGGEMTKNTDGTITAVFRNEKGQIVNGGHGKLKQVGHDFVNISKAIANQIMLMAIIMQLKEINLKLECIIRGLHDDRISEIEGAVNAYNLLNSSDKKNVVLQISTGIVKLKREIEQEISNLSPNHNFGDNWLSKKNVEIEKKYYSVAESISWIIKGYEILIDWDLNYNHENHTKNSVEDFIQFLDSPKWEKLREIARALPYKKNENNGYPEQIWENIIEKKPEVINHLRKKINDNVFNEYIIEGTGHKLLEVLNEM